MFWLLLQLTTAILYKFTLFVKNTSPQQPQEPQPNIYLRIIRYLLLEIVSFYAIINIWKVKITIRLCRYTLK